MNQAHLFEDLIIRELTRLNEQSLAGPLDIEDCRKLEVLSRSWRSYNGAKLGEKKVDLGEMSVADLLALARIEPTTEPE